LKHNLQFTKLYYNLIPLNTTRSVDNQYCIKSC